MENEYGRGTQLFFRAESRNTAGALTDSYPAPVLTLGQSTFDMTHESVGVYTAIIATTDMKCGRRNWKIKTVTDITTIRAGYILLS